MKRDSPGTMKNWMLWAAGFLALLGSSWGGFSVADGRYAKELQTQNEFNRLNRYNLQAELREVQRQKFQLEVQKQQRGGRLTPLEAQRLAELTNQERALEQEIKRLK